MFWYVLPSDPQTGVRERQRYVGLVDFLVPHDMSRTSAGNKNLFEVG